MIMSYSQVRVYKYSCYLNVQCHPDKLPPSLSDEEKTSAIEQFHRIKRAYEILSDNKERQAYDTTSNGIL